MSEQLLYGLAKGEDRPYMEQLLSCSESALHIEAVRERAARDGFHSFRLTTYDGKAPDFIGAINS